MNKNVLNHKTCFYIKQKTINILLQAMLQVVTSYRSEIVPLNNIDLIIPLGWTCIK